MYVYLHTLARARARARTHTHTHTHTRTHSHTHIHVCRISYNWFNKLPGACVISESSELVLERDGSAESDLPNVSSLTYTKRNVKGAKGKQTLREKDFVIKIFYNVQKN